MIIHSRCTPEELVFVEFCEENDPIPKEVLLDNTNKLGRQSLSDYQNSLKDLSDFFLPNHPVKGKLDFPTDPTDQKAAIKTFLDDLGNQFKQTDKSCWDVISNALNVILYSTVLQHTPMVALAVIDYLLRSSGPSIAGTATWVLNRTSGNVTRCVVSPNRHVGAAVFQDIFNQTIENFTQPFGVDNATRCADDLVVAVDTPVLTEEERLALSLAFVFGQAVVRMILWCFSSYDSTKYLQTFEDPKEFKKEAEVNHLSKQGADRLLRNLVNTIRNQDLHHRPNSWREFSEIAAKSAGIEILRSVFA